MLSKHTVIDKIEILENGTIQLRYGHTIVEDESELVRTYSRIAYAPGQDVVGAPSLVQRIAAIVWTPAVIAAFKQAQDVN